MLLDENRCIEAVHVTITQFFPLDIFSQTNLFTF